MLIYLLPFIIMPLPFLCCPYTIYWWLSQLKTELFLTFAKMGVASTSDNMKMAIR